MIMNVHISLFAGYGNVCITQKAYKNRIQELLSLDGVSYDPFSQSLYVKSSGKKCDNIEDINNKIAEMFYTAHLAIQKTEAFAKSGDLANAKPPDCNMISRNMLHTYHKKYIA